MVNQRRSRVNAIPEGGGELPLRLLHLASAGVAERPATRRRSRGIDQPRSDPPPTTRNGHSARQFGLPRVRLVAPLANLHEAST